MNLKQAILFSITIILFGCCNLFSGSNSCSTIPKTGIDSLTVDFKTENQQEIERGKVVTDTVLQNGKVIVLNTNNYININ